MAVMIKLSEQEVRWPVEVARATGSEVDDEMRASGVSGHPSRFCLGYLSGVMCAVPICRDLRGTLVDRVR